MIKLITSEPTNPARLDLSNGTLFDLPAIIDSVDLVEREIVGVKAKTPETQTK